MITVEAEPVGQIIFDRRKTWTVPLIETTYEVEGISRSFDLVKVKQNDYPINQSGTYELLSLLDLGRNVINVSGSNPEENTTISSEVRILRIRPFSDLPLDHWALEPISLSVALGLMSGYPNNTFIPEKGISRAEMAALLVKAAGVSTDRLEEAKSELKFADTKGKWYQAYVNVGSDMGLITGYPNRSFNPEKILNRAEGIVMLTRFAKIAGREGIAFPDLNTGFWANKAIMGAKEAGLLKYLDGKKFEVDHYFSRAEAAEVLYRTRDIQRRVNDFWDYGINNENP
jgi:hypothetical protein